MRSQAITGKLRLARATLKATTGTQTLYPARGRKPLETSLQS